MAKDSRTENKNYQYIQELNSAYLNGKLIIFYGAGLSIPLGLPSWKKLLEYVVGKIIENPESRKQCFEKMEENDFWDSMEYVKENADVDEEKIKSLIASCIKSGQDNNESDLCTLDNNYKDLSESEIPFFITTNYDTFLEKINNQCEAYDVDSIKNQPMAEFLSRDKKKKKILYLHGHINNESSIVITRKSVDDIYKNENWIKFFRNLLNNYHILFIGTSFEDKYLRDFLEQSIRKSRNNYYVITSRKVTIPCKEIFIEKEHDKRVDNIRNILRDIMCKPEEMIWIRLKSASMVSDVLIKKVEEILDKEKYITCDVMKSIDKKYLIISAIHMKKSNSISEAFALYEKKIIKNKNLAKYIDSDGVVYFYSCNKDNFNEINCKQVFKNSIMNLMEVQIIPESRGYIIDRINLELNGNDKQKVEKYRAVRCVIKGNEIKSNKAIEKEYTFYIDKNIYINNAKGYGVEVHVSGFCFFAGKLLMESRDSKAAIASSMLAPVGGRINSEESFEQALMRHFEEDCNLLIDNIELCSTFTTYNANIPGVAFTCNIRKNAKKRTRKNTYALYSKEEVLKLYDQGKVACSKELIIKAFKQGQEYRKKSIKLRIVLWSNCSYRCKGCHHENLNDISLIYKKDKIIENLNKLGEIFDIRKITITGGEPLKDISELEDVVKTIRKNFPLTRISIITNGEGLTEQVVERLRKYNLRYKISIYGFDNCSFEKYTGVKEYKERDYFREFVNKLKTLYDKRIPFTINLPLQKYIFDGVEKIVNDMDIQRFLSTDTNSIKIIDMVRPRSEGKEEFDDLYVPIEKIDTCSLNCSISKKVDCFTYPCKTCKGINGDCFENFALTLQPNGKLLVCKNAVSNMEFSEKCFEDYLRLNDITVEFAEYNRDYGM